LGSVVEGTRVAESRGYLVAAQAQAAKLRALSCSSVQAYRGHANWIAREMSPGK
jgi:hypothetical protein